MDNPIDNDGTIPTVAGMTLRDYFAGQAMQAFITSGEMNGIDTAFTAYAFAESMIEVRTWDE